MTRTLYAYLMQPGVIMTGLIGTLLQLTLGVANNFNIAGIADTISHYGLTAQLTSGGLVAAVTGLIYSLTERISGHTVITGAGAAAGGVSGTLGLALSQALGITSVAAGAAPIINFTMLGTAIAAFIGMIEPTTAGAAPTVPAAFDTMALSQVFATTAAGGGAGALIGRFATGAQTRRAARKTHRPHHAH